MTTAPAILAVGAGGRAADVLASSWAEAVAAGVAHLVRVGTIAVGWSSTCRWIDVSDDGDLLVVVDGRVHDLAPGASPAAALAAAHRRTGAAFASALPGDFVAVVLERATGALSVALDPLGTRPWYVARCGDGHLGAGDVATLLAAPGVDRGVDEDRAVEYLAGVTATDGRTFHRAVSLLPPGCTWRWQDRRVALSRHHRWRLAVERSCSWDEAVERCRSELDRAVARRLAVVDHATSELSGGLDSSAVVGTVLRSGRTDLLAGRLLFDGPLADERRWSDAVLAAGDVTALSVPPWVPTAAEATELTRRLRRPLPDPHFLMFASLRRELLARGRADVLTGLGGDDAFASSGMGEVLVSAAQLAQWPVLARAARATVTRPGAAWRSLLRPMLHVLARRPDRVPPWVQQSAAERAGLRARSARRPPRVTGVLAVDDRIANLSEGYDAAVLAEQAVVSDLVGVRASHPFLDPCFIEATYTLDPTWPTRGDHERALEVAAFADRLPAAVATRRSKADFSEVFWPQVLAPAALDAVRTGPLVTAGWLDLDGFDALVADAARGTARAAIPLGRCVALDRWLRSR